ncbi:MAG: hypothetical protein ACI9Y7_003087, partial [Dokdonia sp.]
MIRFKYALCAMLFLCASVGYAQDGERQGAHENENKFRQLYNEMSTPNSYRTASGAPGHEYYQNEADYKMSIQLDDANQRITGYETITYKNNSPDDLTYLWVQLDQNIRAQDSPAKDKNGGGISAVTRPGSFISSYMKEGFEGGFNINKVTTNGKPLKHTVNFTMMRVD